MWTVTGFADEIAAEPDEQVATLRRLGMTHLELRAAWGTNVADLDDAQLDRLRGVLDGAGIAVSSIGSPIGKVPVDADLDQHLARFERCLHVAHLFGAPFVRVFSFFPLEGRPAAESGDAVLERMRVLVRRVEDSDVVLLHENEKGIYGDTPIRCLELLESIDSPVLRAAWDAANFVQVGVAHPFDDGYAALRPWLAYVHVKDALADGTVVPAGQGAGQLGETLAALRDDGFDGFFSLEPHLATAGSAGGFSGPELFGVAHRAFTGLLNSLAVPYR